MAVVFVDAGRADPRWCLSGRRSDPEERTAREGRPAAAATGRGRRVFVRTTGFVTLDRLLQRLHANKLALAMVLDQPEIPPHTAGSENDTRCQVTKRQVSGGTKTDTGRDCRDAFPGLNKTRHELGYFLDPQRIGIAGADARI